MKDLKDLVVQCKNLQEQRRELEAQAKEVKSKEEELKTQIIGIMQAQTVVTSVHYKGLAYVVLTDKKHLEIVDKELFSQTVLRSLVAAYQEGRPFLDGLLTQLRPSKESVYSYLENHPEIDLATCGLREVAEPEIVFRSSKGA